MPKLKLNLEVMPEQNAKELVDRANAARMNGRVDHKLESRFSMQREGTLFSRWKVFRIDGKNLQPPLFLEPVEGKQPAFGELIG